jgi:hypothetical protein
MISTHPMPPRFTKRRLIFLVALVLVAAGVWLALRPRNTLDPLYAAPRIQWKDHAITLIQQRFADPAWIATQTARLHARTATRPFANWIGDEILLMKNGDWIICQNICHKQDPQIQDLFIGRGSDGRWYYSTFHFCVNMNVLLGEGTQPASLLQFADGYSLRPYDTRSNDCLQSTWTPGLPYGVDYFQNAPRP